MHVLTIAIVGGEMGAALLHAAFASAVTRWRLGLGLGG